MRRLADARGLPVLQPVKLRDPAFLDELADLAPELIVTAAYGRILPPALLELPRLGCLNVHASLLPRHRGAAPIQRAILAGDRETGITMMRMDEGMDTGPILASRRIGIDPDEDAGSLERRLADLAVEMLPETLRGLAEGRIRPRPQPSEGVSFAPPVRKEEGRIDWSRTAGEIRNRVRGLSPRPGAYTFLDGRRIRLTRVRAEEGRAEPGVIASVSKEGLRVGTGDGLISILELQPAGKSPMPVRAFLAGRRLRPGQRFDPGGPPSGPGEAAP